MKRKLLGVTILYVLGVAILQNLGFSVFWKEGRKDVYPDNNFSGEVIGEVTGYSLTSSAYILHITSICVSYDDVKSAVRLGVFCYMEEPQGYAIGDIISVSGSFNEPEQSTNPGQFNTALYYRCRGTDLTSYQPEVTLVLPLSERQDIGYLQEIICKVKQRLYEFRWKLAAVYDNLLDAENAGILKGMVLGDRSGLSKEIQTLYQKNNISHLLAISGLHIGLVSGLLYGLLRLAFGSYLLSGIVGIIITFAYGYMTGASDSSMRAAVMLSISMVGAMLGRTCDLLTAMAISALIIITVNPLKLYDAGFLFSYGAIIGIGIVYPCMEKGLGLKKKISKMLAVSLSIQLVTLPVSLYFYGAVAVYSILLNLIVIPLATPILIFGFAGGILGLLGGLTFFRLLAGWLLFAACILIALITQLCRFVIRLPLASVILGAMQERQIYIYYAGLILLCGCLYYRSVSVSGKENAKPGDKELVRRCLSNMILCSWRHAAACSMLMLLMLVQLIFRRPVNQLTMLDVGQGDSILLQSKSGLHILVDGGSTSQSDVGQYVLQPALHFYGIRRLDYIIVTHADADHINGILYLLEQSDQLETVVDTLLIPLLCKDIEEYQELLQTAGAHGVRVSYLVPGMCLQDEEISMTCLHPSPERNYPDINDMSTVLEVSYGDTSILFTGDISTEVEDELLAYQELLASTDILKVAHHGSRYSTSESFLNLVSPKLSLISCGENNRYGHPHTELIFRLEASGSKILLTPEYGAIEITFDDKWTVKCYR